MNHPDSQLNLVLTRRLADGTIEWIPLPAPERIATEPGAGYALIDRADYGPPERLKALRQGNDLVVEVAARQVLVLEDFFDTAAAAFFPTPDIAGGAGPFSGPPVTPEATGLVWSAVDAPGNTVTATVTDPSPAAADDDGGSNALLWGGLAAGGLGLALAAGGGGGGGGGGSAPAQDTTAPQITSAGAAADIDEDSGAGQIIYTATASDTSAVTWSLDAGLDADAFRIDSASGAVTLLGNPDFEQQAEYRFTVVATDSAGNASRQTVTLTIGDRDEQGPTVEAVALTAAAGARNGILNDGDTVTVTVTLSEPTSLDPASEPPLIALSVGNASVEASYVSGSGTPELRFEYTVQPGDRADDGIAVPANALAAPTGALRDDAGNAASLSHAAVAADSAFRVDTAAPALTASTPADDADEVPITSDLTLEFSEPVAAGSGSITLSDGSDTRVIDVTDDSRVDIDGNRVTIDPGPDLNPGSDYRVQIDRGAITDLAGNPLPGITDSTTLNFETEIPADPAIVVFDLLQGSSSDHSGRTFRSDVSYDIYLRVDSDDADLETDGGGPGTWGTWAGTANLGSDDRIILVGDGEPVQRVFAVNDVTTGAAAVRWSTGFGFDAAVVQGRSFTRLTGFGANARDTATLFESALPGAFLGNQGGQFNTMYLTGMPAGILTSQGLA